MCCADSRAGGDRLGAFQEADGGTLSLDEIAEIPLRIQPKLLRAVQERRVRRLGETGYTPLNVRFVSASHRDLRQMVICAVPLRVGSSLATCQHRPRPARDRG